MRENFMYHDATEVEMMMMTTKLACCISGKFCSLCQMIVMRRKRIRSISLSIVGEFEKDL